MFDLLRKKVSNALKGLSKKEEATEGEGAERTGAGADKRGQDDKRLPEAHGEAVHKPEADVRISASTRLKGVVLNTVQLNDKEIEDFLDSLRISLLESDVSYKTTEDFLGTLGAVMRETRFRSRNLREDILKSVRGAMLDVLKKSGDKVDFDVMIKQMVGKEDGPVRILFIGPNGTGKTTTMGKIAYRLKKCGIGCAFSASDTFRAAAIEQTEYHAQRIGVPVIKSKYGADPASVAFDTIAYAKSHGIPVVLIDTAGRQETNKNLIGEIMKMHRVAKPNLTIFVGESTAGNSLPAQISEFSKHMKIDGIILTKLDCDAKGGNAISISDATGIPILFFGTGESYDSLVPYSPEFVVDSIVPNN
jgi:fused signal recognition particle receptor